MYEPSTSVVLGMRAISSASTVTRQNSPSHSSPVTASGSYPVSSSTVASAARPSSPADSRPFSLDRAMGLLPHDVADLHEPLDQQILGGVDLLRAKLARLARLLELDEPGSDRRLVVELAFRLLLDTLGQPTHPADR